VNYTEKYNLSGKTALVTGAAHGIGRACAVALAKCGVDLALVDINKEGLSITSDMVLEAGRQSILFETDITNEPEMLDVVDKTIKKYAKLDIAFCNAGTFQDVPAETMDLNEFIRVININLIGQFITARAVGRAMILQKSGSIIFTASMSGHIANIPQCQCAYNASKAAVIMLGKSLAIEWAKYNIRVNTISPGYVRTWSDIPQKPEEVGKHMHEQMTPMKRFGQADEMSGLVLYLASNASSFVTGSDILIDGGYTAF
jgi:NAD(P)-dependent dehydrogenase (short-subunit alcohol dehydrogenase family)